MQINHGVCVCNGIRAIHTNQIFLRRSCLEPVPKGISYFSIYTEICLQLVRIRNIVVALIKLLKKGMLMIVGTHTALGNAYQYLQFNLHPSACTIHLHPKHHALCTLKINLDMIGGNKSSLPCYKAGNVSHICLSLMLRNLLTIRLRT